MQGAEFTEFMSQLSDYLSLSDKFQKRLRNETVSLEFIKLFAHEGGCSGEEGRLSGCRRKSSSR